MFAKGILVAALMLGSSAVMAKTCDVELEANDAMSFNTKELKVDGDCTEAKLTLKHVGKMPKSAMGHNVVITKTDDFKKVAKAAGKVSAEDNYVPKDDARVLAHTKLIGGGESDTITIPLDKFEKGGDYTFFCSFPGHWSVMKGKFRLWLMTDPTPLTVADIPADISSEPDAEPPAESVSLGEHPDRGG